MARQGDSVASVTRRWSPLSCAPRHLPACRSLASGLGYEVSARGSGLGKGLRGKVLGWGFWFVIISSGFRVGVQEHGLSLGFMHGVKG